MAIELGLDKTPPSSCDERESLNRIRTWLNCFCVDYSHSVQFGKCKAIQNDYLAKSSWDWYRSSSFNLPFDVHLCAYVQLNILMAEWRSLVGDGVSSRQKYIEVRQVMARVTIIILFFCRALMWRPHLLVQLQSYKKN